MSLFQNVFCSNWWIEADSGLFVVVFSTSVTTFDFKYAVYILYKSMCINVCINTKNIKYQHKTHAALRVNIHFKVFESFAEWHCHKTNVAGRVKLSYQPQVRGTHHRKWHPAHLTYTYCPESNAYYDSNICIFFCVILYSYIVFSILGCLWYSHKTHKGVIKFFLCNTRHRNSKRAFFLYFFFSVHFVTNVHHHHIVSLPCINWG